MTALAKIADTKPKPGDDRDAVEQKILAEARKRYDAAMQYEQENDDEAGDDLRFAAGDQWDLQDKQNRRKTGRPCLTINKMGQYTRQVTGDMRINKAAIKVSPVDDSADPKLSDIMQGLIRNIEITSNAQIAYVQAGKNAALCGKGAFRIVTEYVADDSFDQHICIRRIQNPFAVAWDPGALEMSREDANWCFVTSRMQKADFEAAFPEAGVVDFEPYKNQDYYGDNGWISNETVRIAEYWEKKPVKKIIGSDAVGSVYDITGWTDAEHAQVQIVKQREVSSYQICQYLINGIEILDGPNIWPGKYFPIVPVWGEEISLGDRVYRHGMVRFAKDSQRMYNFQMSQATETAQQSPKAPVAVTVTQIKGQEKDWQALNKTPKPYVVYNSDPAAPGPPQRLQPPTLDAAALTLAQNASSDMQQVIGIYNASLSAPSPETSGKAIQARDRQADVGTFEYIDNLQYAIAHGGKILVDLIPRIYDTERVVRVLGQDDETSYETINKVVSADPMTGRKVLANDLSVGQYDVVVETGPSFSTRRQEAVETLMEFIRVAPQLGALTMDIVAKNMNFPGHEQIENRLKKSLPPGIDDKPEEGQPAAPPPPPPEMLAALEEQQKANALAEQQAAIDAEKNRLEHEKLAVEREKTVVDSKKVDVDRLKAIQDFNLKRSEGLARGVAVGDMDGEGQPVGGNPFDQVAASIAAMAQAQAQNNNALAAMASGIGQLASATAVSQQEIAAAIGNSQLPTANAIAELAARQSETDARQDQRAQRQEAQIVALAAAIAAPKSKTISGSLPSGKFTATINEDGGVTIGNA